MDGRPWEPLAALQANMLSRRQLNALGLDHNYVRHQVEARRWVNRTSMVVSTATGTMSFVQRSWTGPLHAGPGSAIAGLTAAKIHGLKNWDRSRITILVDADAAVSPVDGIDFVRTRRDIAGMLVPGIHASICRVEPAALLFAAYTSSPRTACGLLAAVNQQRLTTTTDLLDWVELMRPLRRARLFRSTLADIDGGAQSLSEIDIGKVCRRFGLPAPDRQIRRRDQHGKLRYTDCEWRLEDGRVVVLEIDG